MADLIDSLPSGPVLRTFMQYSLHLAADRSSNNVISRVAVHLVGGVDVRVKLGENPPGVKKKAAAQFVKEDERRRTTTNGGYSNRQKRHFGVLFPVFYNGFFPSQEPIIATLPK